MDAGKKGKNNLIGRYVIFLIGLLIAAFGVAFSTKAKLGTSPVASVPYSISLLNDTFSFGGWLNLWSMTQISIQVILLRKKCNPFEIAIQTVLAFAYGYMTNFACFLLDGMKVNGYFEQFLCMIASCFILGFGIWLQFKGGVAMLPGEAMNRAISQVMKTKYENVKIFFDIFYIGVSCVICLVCFGKLTGVREGSIIAAIVIGNIIRLYNRVFDSLKRKMIPDLQVQ